MQKDSYNRGGYIAFLFSMVFSLSFFVYIVFVHPGVDLKEVAPTQVQNVAGADAQVQPTKKAADMSKVEKPWIESEDVAAYGAGIYANTCAVCHGQKGLGDGPAGLSLNPRPRNFVEGKWKVGGDSISLYKTLQAGIPGSSMAAFGHLPVKDRWALVQFIRSITNDKVKDDASKLEAFAKDAK